MRIVVALGGNALLQPHQPLSAENLLTNTQLAANALAPLTTDHELILCHGNGPQVGLLAMEDAQYQPGSPYPLDLLVAETEGMIGYPLAKHRPKHSVNSIFQPVPWHPKLAQLANLFNRAGVLSLAHSRKPRQHLTANVAQ